MQRLSLKTALRSLLALLCGAAIAMLTPASLRAQPILADFTTLTPISDGNALTDDRGWANVEINATAFKNQSLVTVGDYQFTSYYAADQTLVLGRRNLATDPNTWFLLRTGETSANINDSHNVSTIGIDGDGILHVAWGVHGNPLRYMRTDQSVLSDNPFTAPGNTSGQIPSQSSGVTYPEFTNIPGTGDMLLAYRTGSSGNGEFQLARWNNGSDTWSAVHVMVGSNNSNTGPQPWIDNDFNSTQAPPNVNAYHNGLVYDSTGRLHATWTWRTGGDSTTGFTDYQSNHNFMYAYSDNHGVDWRLGDGTLLQRNGVHDIDENNATPVFNIPDGSSIINQSSSGVGPDNHLYVANWFAPQAASNNHVRQFMLHEYDGTTWQVHQVTNRNPEGGGIGTNRVPESQLGSARMSRPIVLTDDDNRVFLVYSDVQRGQGVTVAYSQSPERDDWQFVDIVTNENVRLWEPKYDKTRWETDSVLSMLYQPSGQGLSPNAVSVLEWDARTFFQNLAGPPLRIEVDRGTGAVLLKNPDDADVAMTAYTLGSPAGRLLPDRWNSLQDQALAGWTETQALATQLSESNGSGSLLLGENETALFGHPYAGSATAFGIDAPGDLTFQYTADGEARNGMVTYVGQSLNNLTLKIDPDTGQTRLENTSPFSVAIEAYTITSASNSLDLANWNSLDDQNAAGGNWHEANPTTGRLSELISSGDTLLAGSDEFDLGQMFSAAGQEDLVFQFLIAGQSTPKTGVVLYTSLGIPGDYNNNGTVDAADYVVWRKNMDTAGTLPNDTTPGQVTAADYDVWRAHFGESVGSGSNAGSLASAVPEPSTAFLAFTSVGAALLGPKAKRRR